MESSLKETEYLIVGQGICGTLLSYYLRKAGKSVVVVDAPRQFTASKVASGIINPVTGKKWVTTWMAAQLLPFAAAAYTEIGRELGVKLLSEYDLFSFHTTPETQQLFEARIDEDDRWLYTVNNETPWDAFFHFHFGIGAVSPCYVIELQTLLHKWREQLVLDHALIGEEMDWNECIVTADSVTYKNITARKMICCSGAADIDNPYFTRLPFQLNKGEAIIASIPGLPRNHIYKHGVFNMVPWKDGDQFWIGSIFDREYKDESPTAAFRKQVEETLNRWLKLPFTITDHQAALRPATGGQKPFAGMHPLYPSLGIFNGMGSKGCSQAPYLAYELAQHLIAGAPLTPEADISRFKRILSVAR